MSVIARDWLFALLLTVIGFISIALFRWMGGGVRMRGVFEADVGCLVVGRGFVELRYLRGGLSDAG